MAAILENTSHPTGLFCVEIMSKIQDFPEISINTCCQAGARDMLVCVHVSDQAFMVNSPHIAAMAYKYRHLVLTGETPLRSQNS